MKKYGDAISGIGVAFVFCMSRIAVLNNAIFALSFPAYGHEV
jgi:hypothetical protein